MKISKIILYDEPAVPQIQLENLKSFLEELFPVRVETRENILKFSKKETPKKLAESKIYHLKKDFTKNIPSEEEILFEELNTKEISITENIIMYDGFQLQKIFTDLIPTNEEMNNIFHVCFTNKLTCTFDYTDYRYHGRALIGANPAIISTTGIIEAPAKPRGYYYDLAINFSQGVNVESIKQKYKGTYLEYNDVRLSKIVEGYLLQAIFYYETGQPFCDNYECRLFNSHWQKDLLHSQLKVGRLCEIHQKILEDILQT